MPSYRMRILIIEECGPVRTVLARILSHCGINASCAETREKGITQCSCAVKENYPFDAVILNWDTSSDRCRETLKDIFRLIPGAKIVASIDPSDHNIIKNSRDHGFAAVLVKPYEITAVKRLLLQLADGNLHE